MKINKVKMYRSAQLGYATATDYADYLVGKGVPFRQAHHIAGKTVAYAIEKIRIYLNLPLKNLGSLQILWMIPFIRL